MRQLRGVVQLATEVTVGIADIAEAVHRSVWATIGFAGGEPQRTDGLTGAVYRSVRAITRGVGGSAEQALRLLESIPSHDASAPDEHDRPAWLAALNGVIGDRLLALASPLALAMTLRVPPGPPSGRILLLVHGLCLDDRCWSPPAGQSTVDMGRMLAAALGATPVYVRYNSGLHISSNGRELSEQLERLLQRWPVPVEQLTVLGHSMGGLVARSAVQHATEVDAGWLGRLRQMVFLGTPHHGAPLERAGNVVDTLLEGSRFTAPFARIGATRSAGITDLRHGNLVDDDWRGRSRFARMPDRRRHLPLPAGVHTLAVAASLAARRSKLADRLLGDGLVPLRSALGEHDDGARSLQFDAQHIAWRTGHIELLRCPEVAARITDWLVSSRAG